METYGGVTADGVAVLLQLSATNTPGLPVVGLCEESVQRFVFTRKSNLMIPGTSEFNFCH